MAVGYLFLSWDFKVSICEADTAYDEAHFKVKVVMAAEMK